MLVVRRPSGLTRARLEFLEARVAIEEIVYQYARACDRMDEAMLRDCFWPDALHQHGRFSGASHDFVGYAMSVLATMRFSAHHVTNVAMEIRGARGFSECHFLAHHRRSETPEQPERDDFYEGRYLDFFERRGGTWKIVRRRGLNDFVSAAFAANVPYAAWPAGQHSERAPDDAYYEMRAAFRAL